MLFSNILNFVIIFVGIFYSIIFHEIAHGYMAYVNGDDTAKRMNRLSLNPVHHIDLLGTVIIPLFCFFMNLPIFGWAKPVPINPYLFSNRKRGMIMVSLAGVTVNFILMVILFFLYSKILWQSFLYLASVNLVLFVFNLIPLPPLDGYNFMVTILPEKFSRIIKINETTFIVIFIFLIITGWIRYIYYPIYNFISRFLLNLFM